LHQDLDWSEVVRFAINCHVGSLAYHGLKQSTDDQLPQAAHSRLHEIYQVNALRNLRLAKRLFQIVELFNDQGIENLVFKGPAVAQQAYRDLSLRQFVDLDLLIHPQDFHRAYDLLIQAGFSPSAALSRTQQRWLLQTAVEYQFRAQGDFIEIHWDLAPDTFLYPLKARDFWDDSTQLQILDHPMRTLSVEKAVFFTCFHAARHAWESLKYAADLAHYSYAYPSLDWLALLEYARRHGFYRLMCLSLLFSAKLCGAVYPPQVSQSIAEEAQARALFYQAIRKISARPVNSSVSSRLFFYIRSRERWRDRLHILLEHIFIPVETDWRTIPLPACLFPFYYLFHPGRVLVAFLKESLGFLFKLRQP
jgi:hypothetical protein